MNNRVVKARPSVKELYEELKQSNFTVIGKKYGVSDNAIRKWCKIYNIPSKSIYYRRLNS